MHHHQQPQCKTTHLLSNWLPIRALFKISSIWDLENITPAFSFNMQQHTKPALCPPSNAWAPRCPLH